jgi:hypothetical protein
VRGNLANIATPSLLRADRRVVEVNRPSRQNRRKVDKSDPADAVADSPLAPIEAAPRI